MFGWINLNREYSAALVAAEAKSLDSFFIGQPDSAIKLGVAETTL